MTRPYQLSVLASAYDQTAAEIAASVTPTNYQWPPGDVRRYGADSTGVSDSTTAISNAALVAKTAGGGIVTFPAGTFVCASQLTLGVSQGVRFVGASSNNQSTGGTTIKYTGTTSPFMSVSGSAASLSLENLNFLYSNASFTGTLLALPVNQLYMTNCFLGGVSITTAQYLLDLNSSTNININHTAFAGAQYAISGQKSDGTGFCNVVGISQCLFSGQSTGAIRNPGQAWTISGCDFENLTGGTGSAIYMDSACQAYGIAVSGCWFGDAAATSSAYVWILWQGHGLSVTGCYFNGTGTASPDGIKLLGTSYGMVVTGCYFSKFANAINIGSYLSNATSLTGNHYSSCTANISGTPVSDHFSYTSNTFTPSPTSLTVVLGGGSVTYSGWYEKRGTYVYFSIVIITAGGATTAATAGSTLFALPFAASGTQTYGTCSAASPNTALSVGSGFVGTSGIYTPTWSATSNTIVITGTYQSTVP